MIILITVLLSVLFFLGSRIYDSEDKDVSDTGGLFLFVSFIGLFVLGIAHFIVITHHADSLSKVRKYHLIMQAIEKRITGLKQQFSEIVPLTTKGKVVLANKDSPIKSLVYQMAKAEEDLSIAKIKLAEIKMNIEARKIGFMWHVVWIYGEE